MKRSLICPNQCSVNGFSLFDDPFDPNSSLGIEISQRGIDIPFKTHSAVVRFKTRTPNQNEIEKILRSPLVSDWKIYHENLASFELISKSVTLNKPRYVGLTVLELSKLLMYNFHYNYILKKFENVKILLSDTDSFCYNIKTKKNFFLFFKKLFIEIYCQLKNQKNNIPITSTRPCCMNTRRSSLLT